MPSETDTENTNALQPGQKAYAVLRSDGSQSVIVGYASWLAGDWFVVALVSDACDPDQRHAYAFRPISAIELTDEQYAEMMG